MLWSDGDRHIPCDYRLYDKGKDGLTENDHFRAMLQAAQGGVRPRMCCLRQLVWWGESQGDSWPRLEVADATEGESQHQPRSARAQPVCQTAIAPTGTVVDLEGYGLIRVFKIVSRDGDIEYWATNDLAMDELERLRLAERCWAIENYHRVLKQCCGVERCRCVRRRRSAITSDWRSVRSCVWSIISSPPGSVGMRRRPGLSRCGPELSAEPRYELPTNRGNSD